MALIPCRECEGMVSSEAAACPRCGLSPAAGDGGRKANRPKRGGGFVRGLGFIVVSLVVIVVGSNLGSRSTTDAPASAIAPARAAIDTPGPQIAAAETQPPRPDPFQIDQRGLAVLKLVVNQDVAVYQEGGTSFLNYRTPRYPSEIPLTTVYSKYAANEVSADNEFKGKLVSVRGTTVGVKKDFLGGAYVDFSLVGTARVNDSNLDQISSIRPGQSVVLLCEGSGVILSVPQFRNCEVGDQGRKRKDREAIMAEVSRWMLGGPKPSLIDGPSDKLKMLYAIYYIGARTTAPMRCDVVLSTECENFMQGFKGVSNQSAFRASLENASKAIRFD